jgi:predicted phosphodiesterase
MIRHAPAVLLLVSSGIIHAQATPSGQAWIQYGPRGAEIRAATQAVACPKAQVDGKDLALTLRAAPDAAYPIRLCQAGLPSNPAPKNISVFGQALPLPKDNPRTIVIVGDTGCRMKGTTMQACNDPLEWPFKQMAQAIAQKKPDLIIHVGDYHYREAACPEEDGGCSGSPWGDNLATWQADFLSPAAPALRAAPWVFVRGNHETCTRGGKGWSRFFDPHAFNNVLGCNGDGAPWSIRLKGLTLGVIDNASIAEGAVDPESVTQVRQALAEFGRQAKETPLWVLMHRPVRSASTPRGSNSTLAEAFDQAPPPALRHVIAGHEHNLQLIRWQDGSAAQLIVGHGGSSLYDNVPASLNGIRVAGKIIGEGQSRVGDFGFIVLTQQATGWQLSNHDRFGQALSPRCLMTATLNCETSPSAD